MSEVIFSARPSLPARETVWRVATGRLFWGHDAEWRNLGLDEIVRVQVFGSPSLTAPYLGGATVAQGMEICVLTTRAGEKLTVSSNHFLSVGQFESRVASFRPFVAALLQEVARANPSARFVAGMPPGLWSLWLGVMVVCGLAALLGLAVVGAGMKGGGAWDTALGLVFLVGAGISLVGVARTVASGRPRPFTMRPA